MDKQRLRFTVGDDICLLKEVLSENPFQSVEKWKDVHKKMNLVTGKEFTIRCLKEHLQHLIALFKKEDNINKKKSGTEEEYNDLKVLLQNVLDLSNEFSSKQSLKKVKSCKATNSGVLSRNESVVLRQLNINDNVPIEIEILKSVSLKFNSP